MKNFETIVVGLGAMGSATVYQLAKQGNDVLGIDKHKPPHSKSSSYGQTRLTRLAVGEGEAYLPLVRRSHEIWRELEKETGEKLLVSCSGLLISSEAQTSINHVADLFDRTIALARKHDISHETLDAAEIRERFPQFDVDDDEQGYFEDSAGYVFPNKCVSTQFDLAQKYGAQIRTGETMTAYSSDSDGVVVETDQGKYQANNLVLAVGPWLPGLLDQNLARYFEVYRQVLYWFNISESELSFTAPEFPVFIWELKGDKKGMYGFPSLTGEDGKIKIATDQYQTTTTPDSLDTEVTQDEMDSFYKTHASHINGVVDNCVQAEACLYTVTPDSGFVIDHHPDHENIVIVSPCSGHGFKHSAAIGEAVSQLVATGQSEYDLDGFSLDRFV